MDTMLQTIEDFILEARKGKGKSFAELYRRLQSPEGHIGLRSGVIPIYLAAVIHNYKREVIISDQYGQVPLSADVLMQINAKPEMFNLSYLDWDADKEKFVKKLDGLFSEYIIDAEKGSNSYDYVASAMRRWYMALPKYAKESHNAPDGERICKEYIDYLKLLKVNTSGNELLFKKLPKIFGENEKELVDSIKEAKTFYDTYLMESTKVLAEAVKSTFVLRGNKANIKKMSLASVIKDWCEKLDPAVFEQLFSDGTERMLELFKNVTNDDYQTITSFAKIATDLRLEDWDEKVKELFLQNIGAYKATAEAFRITGKKGKDVNSGAAYQIVFTDENGNAVTKRFDRVEDTSKGKLLHNQVTSALDAMGRAMSDQEKRQVLMEILKDLC